MCGATWREVQASMQALGLSPRVRGNLDNIAITNKAVGPIPACAGQPTGCIIDGPALRAYPRVCGATGLTLDGLRLHLGLSPRVRGNQEPSQDSTALTGPIPACAGQPPADFPGRHLAWAYPRVCGATSWLRGSSRPGSGLSPRVRGNPVQALIDCFTDGPIPACAGQPLRPPQSAAPLGAYPRVCGATCEKFNAVPPKEGLSPRVRGNLIHGPSGGGKTWPIPACAGQPTAWCLKLRWMWAYPRVCGATV